MIVVEITQKGARLEGVESLIQKALSKNYKDANVRIYRKDPSESRSDRFSEAQSLVSDAKSQAEELRDELQNWIDGLPENLQSGSKADELQQAIDELEQFINSCDEAESTSVDFPGMY